MDGCYFVLGLEFGLEVLCLIGRLWRFESNVAWDIDKIPNDLMTLEVAQFIDISPTC